MLVGALLIQLNLGTIYGYSIFWEPLEQVLWPPVTTVQSSAADQAPDVVMVAADSYGLQRFA